MAIELAPVRNDGNEKGQQKVLPSPPVSDKRLFAALLKSINLGTHIQGMVGGTMNEAWIPLDIITGAGLVSKCLATWDCVLHKNCPCAFPTMIKFRNPLETFIKVHAINLEVLFVSRNLARAAREGSMQAERPSTAPTSLLQCLRSMLCAFACFT